MAFYACLQEKASNDGFKEVQGLRDRSFKFVAPIGDGPHLSDLVLQCDMGPGDLCCLSKGCLEAVGYPSCSTVVLQLHTQFHFGTVVLRDRTKCIHAQVLLEYEVCVCVLITVLQLVLIGCAQALTMQKISGLRQKGIVPFELRMSSTFLTAAAS